MVLAGLPAPARGSVVLCSFFSVLVSTAGLALLRGTRPSEVGGHAMYVHAMYRVMGVFGALLYFSGLILGDIPMLMGVSTEDEGTAAAIMQCTLPLMCWVAERYFVTGRPLPQMQTVLCGVAWFGSTLVEWAGPKPYDNMSTGLEGQIAGCDGGFRSPFLIYAAVWLTAITFGTLLLCCDDGSTEVATNKVAALEAGEQQTFLRGPWREQQLSAEAGFRRLVLPFLAGLSTSMSGLVFAEGAAGNEMGWIFLGACLTVVVVICAWDWLWRLELTLGAWAPICQVTATLLRLVQGHLVFRDFRWDPDGEHGVLVMWKRPGLEIFLIGFLTLFVMALLYLTCMDQWTDSETHGVISLEDLHQRSSEPECKPLLGTLQWLLVPFCMYFFFRGITEDLMITDVMTPHVAWAQTGTVHKAAARDSGSDHHKAGKSYLELITFLYDRRLPCSALVVAYNTVITPPIQFAYVFALLTRPWCNCIPSQYYVFMRTELVNQAPFRFSNPMVLMLLVALQNMSFLGSKHFEATLGEGFWYFVAYCLSFVCLTALLDLGHIEQTLNGGVKDLDRQRLRDAEDSDGSEDEDDADSDATGHAGSASLDPLWTACYVALLLACVVAMYLGITRPFLIFEFRLSGIIFLRTDPTITEFWQQLFEYYPILGIFAACTLIFFMLVWVPLRLLCAAARVWGLSPAALGLAQFLERAFRPWVMGHTWSVACLVLYYIVTARNKAIIEACAHFPDAPVGLLAVAAMGGCVWGLHFISPWISSPQEHGGGGLKSNLKIPTSLPGGITVWYVGPVLLAAFWVILLYNNGPVAEKEIQSLNDVNTMLSTILPATNDQLSRRLPESAGDCEALSTKRGGKPQKCVGHSALAHHTSVRTSGITQTQMDIAAEWAEGIHTLRFLDLRVSLAPEQNVTSPKSQQWRLTLHGQFRNLTVMFKVDVNRKEFIHDYLCCKPYFNFVLEATATCSEGIGFHDVSLHVPHLDAIDFVQKGHIAPGQNSAHQGWTTSFEVDYGNFTAVNTALRNFMTGKTGHLVIENSDGSTTDPSNDISKYIEEIIRLNTGSICVPNF